TAQPSCSASPSKTRAGRRIVTSGADGCAKSASGVAQARARARRSERRNIDTSQGDYINRRALAAEDRRARERQANAGAAPLRVDREWRRQLHERVEVAERF